MSNPISAGSVPTSRSSKRRRRRRRNCGCQPTFTPPKTRLGNGRVLVNGAGRGSDAAKNFMNSDI